MMTMTSDRIVQFVNEIDPTKFYTAGEMPFSSRTISRYRKLGLKRTTMGGKALYRGQAILDFLKKLEGQA